jgi:hypothetical protein
MKLLYKKMLYLLTPVFMLLQFGVRTEAQITAERLGDKIEIRINKSLFTNYILSENEKYPFFFPLNGPSKASVTSMKNANFPHHSSLFFGCDKVNGGNYWQQGLERGQIIPLRADIIVPEGEKVVIENENIWKRPGAMAPIKDFRRITISAPSKDLFQIDFDITMEMLMDVTIFKTNHSLFSVRMDPDLAVLSGGTMVNAEGDTGEEETFGKRSGWMDCHGTRMGKKEGIAIFQHPSNEWYPAPWFTRDYGFFSPTPMYWPENGEKIEFDKGKTIRLRYRVLVHSGDHLDARIADHYRLYSEE